MKFKFFLFPLVLTILACSNPSDQKSGNADSLATTTTNPAAQPEDSAPGFDITKIPVSNADFGNFPYFSAPQKTNYINGGGKKLDFDQSFVNINGTMTPVEGPSFRAFIHAEKGEDWMQFYVDKSYDDLIVKMGGVKISEGTVSGDEVDRIGKAKLKSGSQGSFDYWNSDPIKTYVIRKADGKEVYIQLQTNSASGSILIAEKGVFNQTIALIKAEEIQSQLDADGKAILYISFDTDKATLQPDGEKVVKEINKLLNVDKTIKLSIEGHTDDTGGKEHNLALSKNRAETVLNALLTGGIAKDRLVSTGFGPEKPLVANSSEENKAKNRRVELVKIKS